MALNDRQRVFVSEYVQDWNGTAAAIRAGYAQGSAYSVAYHLLRKPEVQEEIKRRIADVAMTADEALVRLAEQARAAYAAYITEEGRVDLAKMLKDGRGHLIKGIKLTRQGREVQFHDAQTALVQIARAHGVFGPKGTADDPVTNVTMTLDEWRAEAERRRAQAGETTQLFEGEA